MRTSETAPEGRESSTAGPVVLEDVGHAFGEVATLARISLRVAPGEVVALVGPSGCGKSTLLDLVCGLGAPTHGRIDAPRAVLMPQRDGLLAWLSALDNAALAPRLAGASQSAARERAHALLGRLGLAGFEDARPEALSGGMRQRVAFARPLLADRVVVLSPRPASVRAELVVDQPRPRRATDAGVVTLRAQALEALR